MDCRLKRNINKNRCKILRSIKGIPNKDLKWGEVKAKFPKMNPKGDFDKDGRKNKKDCRPLNKKKQDDYYSTTAYNPYAQTDLVVNPRTYRAYQIIKYGKELGLPAKETHEELKNKGYSGDDMRNALNLYEQSKRGVVIDQYGSD
jgi:hypothetical protein